MTASLFSYFYQAQKFGAYAPLVIKFFGEYLPYVLVAGLLAYLLFYHSRRFDFKRRLFIVVSALLSSILAYMGVLVLHVMYISPRPFASLPDIKPLIETGKAIESFPSVHTTVFFAMALFLYFYHKRLGIAYLVGALLIGVARIIAGVHWPSDVAVGALLGMAGALVIRWFTLSIKRNL